MSKPISELREKMSLEFPVERHEYIAGDCSEENTFYVQGLPGPRGLSPDCPSLHIEIEE